MKQDDKKNKTGWSSLFKDKHPKPVPKKDNKSVPPRWPKHPPSKRDDKYIPPPPRDKAPTCDRSIPPPPRRKPTV